MSAPISAQKDSKESGKRRLGEASKGLHVFLRCHLQVEKEDGGSAAHDHSHDGRGTRSERIPLKGVLLSG
jgi:hypothetical protein